MSLICQLYLQLVLRDHSQIFLNFNWFWSFLWMDTGITVSGNFFHYSFWNICEWKFFPFIVFWDSYSQVPLKLRLNASSRHGDTLPSVFSINKKEICNFWHSSISAPRGNRTRIAGSADQWLTHYTIWAVDKNATYLDIFICSISVNSGQIWFKNAHAVNTFTLVLFISKMRFNLDYKIDRHIMLWFQFFFGRWCAHWAKII